MKRSKLLFGALALGGLFTLVSCGGLDEKDKIVDKAIDEYVTNYLIKDIKDDTVAEISGEYSNFTNFWTYLVVAELKENKYSIDIKNENSAIYNYIKNYDVNTLTGVDFGKYYYYAKAFDLDLKDYKAKYAEFVNNSLESEYYEYGEYSIPFEIAPAKKFNVQSYKLTDLLKTTYKPSTEYGYDGMNWFYQVNTLLGNKVNEEYLTELSKATYDNPTSIALSIASFAASNKNVRQYTNNGKNLLDLLLESYDSNLGLIKYAPEDTDINYSTNQIYASLIAYKYQRDTKTAVNIFK